MTRRVRIGMVMGMGCVLASGGVATTGCGREPISAAGDTDTDGTGSSTGAPATSLPPPDGGDSNDPATSGASAGSGTAATDDGPADSGGPPADSSGGDGGGGETCCEAHASPSCGEPEVAECVCAANAACCAFEWDRSCADLAVGSCAATCGDDPTGSDTGPVGGACDRVVQIELAAADATLTGGWQLSMSMLGEGEIAALAPGQFDGSVLWEPEIPCDDTWFIWVRYFENGQDDSYYATVDGEPEPAAVFEGDCTFGGDGWGWALLNWRDEATQGACEYTEDPWTPDFTAGTHAIEISYRESIAIGRLVITNDESYTP